MFSIARRTVAAALLTLVTSGCRDSPVEPTRVATITVTAPSGPLSVGQSVQLSALLFGGEGQILTGRTVAWVSGRASVATVDGGGKVTGISVGEASISAISESRVGTVTLTVRQTVASVEIAPAVATLEAGATLPLTATVRDPAGNTLAGRVVTWSSGTISAATVNELGVVTGVAAGQQAIITAASEGKTAMATITVIPVQPPAKVNGVWDWTERITDPTIDNVCSDTGSYVFTQTNGAFEGRSQQVGICVLPDRSYVNNSTAPVSIGVVKGPRVSFTVGWASGPRCDYSGTLAASSVDSLSGTVACGGNVRGTWQAVRAGGLGSVKVVPASPRLLPGATMQLDAELYGVSGNRVFGRDVSWSSSDASVATIALDGIAKGVGAGRATITATVAGSTGASGTTSLTVPAPLVLTSLTAGVNQTCARDSDGAAYCWGFGNHGQLGDGLGEDSPTPVGVSGGLSITAMDAGFHHVCAVTTAGAAYCWGWNDYGELGNGSKSSSLVPVPVSGRLHFVSLSVGNVHSCGLTERGAVYCWGENNLGQLGDGSTTPRLTPVLVAGGLTFVALSAGGVHSCGLVTSGAAYCWGNDHGGELGAGIGTFSSVPVAVAGELRFSSIAAGAYHSCGVTVAGAAYCWGQNQNGQLGDGSTVDHPLPTPVSGALLFQSLSAGIFHTCGIASGGVAYCWGLNGVGELGDNSTHDSATPMAVAGGLRFSLLSAAGWYFLDEPLDVLTDHTCGITTDQVAYCWGSNDTGQLGNGMRGTNSSVPVKVAGQR